MRLASAAMERLPGRVVVRARRWLIGLVEERWFHGRKDARVQASRAIL